MNAQIEIQKQEVALGKLIIIEVLRLLLGIVVAFCSFLFISSKFSFVFMESIAYPIRFVLFLLLTLIGFAIIFKGVYAITSILMLKILDSHIYESKSLFKILKNSFSTTKTTGSLYQQSNGTIFRLVAPICTMCETKSKSSMHFIYEKKNKCYYLICNADKNHKTPFHPKNRKQTN